MAEDVPIKPPHRPPPTEEQMDSVFRQLEPYLKSGLSLNKSATKANTPTSTIYEWYDKYDYFTEKIKQSKIFFSIMMTSSVMKQMQTILNKQEEIANVHKRIAKGEKILIVPELSSDDLSFIKWVASNSKATQEEFGKRIEHSVVDPELELKKLMGMIDESAEE